MRQSIWKSLNDVKERQGRPTAERIAMVSGLRQKNYSITIEQANAWLRMLVDSAEEYVKAIEVPNATKQSATSILADGVTYGLTLETLQGQIAVEYRGSGALTNGSEEIPLVKAMQSIRRAISELGMR